MTDLKARVSKAYADLTAEYEAWGKAHNIPDEDLTSADEVAFEFFDGDEMKPWAARMTPEERRECRRWLGDFCDRWEVVEWADRGGGEVPVNRGHFGLSSENVIAHAREMFPGLLEEWEEANYPV